jgi:hypothetical protein
MTDESTHDAPPPRPEARTAAAYPEGQPAQPQQPQQPQPRLGAGMAITALVLGILGILTFFVLIGGVLGLVALILGVVASRRAKRGLARGRGMAITGAVLGLLALLGSIAIVAIGAWFLNSNDVKDLRDCLQNAGSDQSAQRQCRDQFQQDVQN